MLERSALANDLRRVFHCLRDMEDQSHAGCMHPQHTRLQASQVQ